MQSVCRFSCQFHYFQWSAEDEVTKTQGSPLLHTGHTQRSPAISRFPVNSSEITSSTISVNISYSEIRNWSSQPLLTWKPQHIWSPALKSPNSSKLHIFIWSCYRVKYNKGWTHVIPVGRSIGQAVGAAIKRHCGTARQGSDHSILLTKNLFQKCAKGYLPQPILITAIKFWDRRRLFFIFNFSSPELFCCIQGTLLSEASILDVHI